MEKLTDKELLVLVKNKNTEAETIFYKRYFEHSKKLGKYYSFKYGKGCGISEDDFTAVAFETTLTAVNTFQGRSKTFYSYWKLLVRNAVIDYLHNNSYFGKMRHLGEISFDDAIYDEESTTKHDVIGMEDKHFDEFMLKEEIKEIITNKNNHFSVDESIACYCMFILSLEAKDISKKLKWSIHKTYKVCQSGKDKLSVIIKNRYFK